MSAHDMSASEKPQYESDHVEAAADSARKDDVEVIVDADAAGYTDHHIVIDDKTNKRLLRMINRR